MKWASLAASIIIAGVAVASMTYGSTYVVPDLVRVDYGLPLRWGFNTLDTIAGPVNRWNVDTSTMLIDLVFWFAALIIVQQTVRMRESKKNPQ